MPSLSHIDLPSLHSISLGVSTCFGNQRVYQSNAESTQLRMKSSNHGWLRIRSATFDEVWITGLGEFLLSLDYQHWECSLILLANGRYSQFAIFQILWLLFACFKDHVERYVRSTPITLEAPLLTTKLRSCTIRSFVCFSIMYLKNLYVLSCSSDFYSILNG